MLLRNLLSLSVGVLLTTAFSDDLFQDIVHHGKYTKLAACITSGRLFEEFLNKGACDLKLCKSQSMSQVEIVKIRNSPEDENGTGFIALNHDAKEVIVAFRGSTTKSDWLSDFEIFYEDYVPRYPYKNLPECVDCKLHRGFYKHLTSITEDIIVPIEDIYEKQEFKSYKLVLVGHSLGGALAALIGIEFRVKGYKPLVITFGSPALFNKPMKEWIDEVLETKQLANCIRDETKVDWGLIRITHKGDYVPMLPPQFEHAGVEFFIDKYELPHTKDDVNFVGPNISANQTYRDFHEVEKQFSKDALMKLLHAKEHRTYFMTVNKCEDPDYI